MRSLASGIVAIDVPDELAWTTTLEWNNIFSPIELKKHELRAFVAHFPRSGLAFSFKALLYTVQDDQFIAEEKERFQQQDVDLPRHDPLSLAIIGLEEAPRSVLAHCIAAALYLLDRDWLSCSDVATSGLERARRLEADYAVDLSMVKAGLDSSLASALTHLHPPQHHARALRLADAVLSRESESLDPLLCKGYIAQTAGRWEQARSLFASVASATSPSDRALALQRLSVSQTPTREARLEVGWCDVKLARLDEAKVQLLDVIGDLDTASDANTEDQAKAWWRLGSCLWAMGGRHREETSEAFTCFITALKRDSSYAPAFTSLGLYYSTVSQPIDASRASKCFQKAFELDPRESEAARHLAQGYADEEEWDLVYLVAHRTIEGEGGTLALNGQVASQRRHITRNPWAWTALGSTELVRQHFEKAIVAFQVALRSFPDDGSIWMRLGEAYVASGRLNAALKTFEKSQELMSDSEQTWQPQFSIASVQRQQGKFQEALAILQPLCTQKPDQQGIQLALAETRLSLGLHEIREGYTLRGKASLMTAMVEASAVLARDEQMFSAWKVLADGLIHCHSLRLDVDEEVMQEIESSLIPKAERYSVDTSLPSISSVTLDKVFATTAAKTRLLFLAAYLAKLRVLLHHNDEQVAGSAWMDLTVCLHQLSLLYEEEERDEESKESQSQAIGCAKEALKLEPGNAGYWNAMGSLVFESSVKLAQHCYLKAIEGDARNAVPWTSLGFLYLRNDDLSLATECFVKAQTLDPDHVPAWVGQAMVAGKQDNASTCRSLFQHAHAVREGGEMEAAYGYASSLFEALSSGASVPASQLHSAAFALSSYLSQRPDDVSALHLSALFAERLGELEMAIERIERASSKLEEQYERDESPQKARLFAVCMANLGRIRMANGDYEGGKDAFDMCLGLLDTGAEEEDTTLPIGRLVLTIADLKRAQVGAHCGTSIAQQELGEGALDSLRVALDEIGEAEDKEPLRLLLAQMLWTASEKEEAESMVMEALSLHPKSVSALLMLGTMSILNKDDEQLELVQAEMQDIIAYDGSGQVSAFLAFVHLLHGKVGEAMAMLRRGSSCSIGARLQLVKLLLQVAIDARLRKSDAANADTLAAKEEALLLHDHIQRTVSQTGQDWLVSSIRNVAISAALQGAKGEAVEMATRCVSLEPAQLYNWTLLEAIHSMTAQEDLVSPSLTASQ